MKPEDYVLFMFSMKGVGKRVGLAHVKEKMERDLGSGEMAETVLRKLVEKGFLEEIDGRFGITEKGEAYFKRIYKGIKGELLKVNRPWSIVYMAKKYYPIVIDTVFDFCKDRYVGFYCLFTEKRFFRRDFRGKKIVIKSRNEVLRFVGMHCIDVIPSVHKVGSKRPDWLVVDIDPGPKVGLKKVIEVTLATFDLMKKLELNPRIKFSGSRGFQIWSMIEDFAIPKNYKPMELKSKKREINYFTIFSDFVRVIQNELENKFPGLTTSTVSSKEEREDKILLDPSSMKPMGLVRVPYGVHSKTGLVSLPLKRKDLKRFNFDKATTEKAAERYEKKGNEFDLVPSSPRKLLELL